MKTPYLTLNTDAVRSSSGKTFIYVLMLNVDDEHKPVPFHVGATKNLTLRFSNHRQIAWHFRSFRRPVSIWVAGSVKDAVVADAELELKGMLSNQGYFLADSGLQKTWSTSLKEMDTTLIHDYISAVDSKKSVLPQWEKKWLGKHKDATSSEQNSEKSNMANVNDLVALISCQTFSNDEERNVAVRIAQQYNFSTEISRVAFKGVESNTDVELLKRTLNKIRHVWLLERKLDPLKFNSFKLTRKIKAEVEERLKLTEGNVS